MLKQLLSMFSAGPVRTTKPTIDELLGLDAKAAEARRLEKVAEARKRCGTSVLNEQFKYTNSHGVKVSARKRTARKEK